MESPCLARLYSILSRYSHQNSILSAELGFGRCYSHQGSFRIQLRQWERCEFTKIRCVCDCLAIAQEHRHVESKKLQLNCPRGVSQKSEKILTEMLGISFASPLGRKVETDEITPSLVTGTDLWHRGAGSSSICGPITQIENRGGRARGGGVTGRDSEV